MLQILGTTAPVGMKDMLAVSFKTNPERENAIVDCMIQYGRLDARTVRDLVRQGWVNCYIPRSNIEAFCGEMARLEAPVMLYLSSTYGLAEYCFDPFADTFYKRDKANGFVRVAQSDLPISYYIIEPATLCLFGNGAFTDFEHYRRENSGYPEFPWQLSKHEWDFYTTILRFSKNVSMKMIWEPRHDYEVEDWSSKSFFHAVNPAGQSRDTLPSTDEIMRRLKASAKPKNPLETESVAASAKPVCKSAEKHATMGASSKPASHSDNVQAKGKTDFQPVRAARQDQYTGSGAVWVVASRMSPDMSRISSETLFQIGSSSDTIRKENCVFYHPAFAQKGNAWMSMKSAWQKNCYCCIVMTDQSEEWARDVSKRLNRQLKHQRFLFLRPVMISGRANLSPDNCPQTIARWYAPLEKKYYKITVEWDGYSHDGSEDYYSLMLYEE